MMSVAIHLDDANRIIAQQQVRIEQLTQEAAAAHTLHSTVEQLSADLLKLNSQIAWLKKQLFGRKSEKYFLPAEAGLFADLPSETEAVESASVETQTQTITYERDIASSGGRGKRLPIPDDLPRVERVHDLPESEKTGMKRIGQDISEKVEFEPGKVYVIRDVQIKYAKVDECLDGSTPNVVLAPKPDEGLPKCIAGPSLLAHIAVSKFADSLPLHRLEGILRRSGVELSRSSMCRWMQGLGELCSPLLKLMKDRLLRSHVIQADETPVQQQMRGEGAGGIDTDGESHQHTDRRNSRHTKNRDPRDAASEGAAGGGGTSGGGGTKTCYFWSYVGDAEHPYILYD